MFRICRMFVALGILSPLFDAEVLQKIQGQSQTIKQYHYGKSANLKTWKTMKPGAPICLKYRSVSLWKL